MMRLVALFGLIGGGILAVGRLTAAQWHAIGQTLLALTLAYGLAVLPWLLAMLFAWRYWRWKRTALSWISFGKAQIASNQVQRDLEWKAHHEAAWRTQQNAAGHRPQQRKRSTR